MLTKPAHKENILLKTGLLPCPNSPLRIQYLLTPSHSSNWKVYSFNLIHFGAPRYICALARQGLPVRSARGSTFHPGHKVEKRAPALPPLPRATCREHSSGNSSSWACAAHRVGYSLPFTSEQTHPCRACVGTGFVPMQGQGSAPPPHHPWKLWGFSNTVQLLSKSVQF